MTYTEKGVVEAKELPLISRFQFNNLVRSGRKLVLFNNNVLDVETFMGEHPGTRFVIEENIGREIGKYFYGAYSLEENVAPHVHSRYAADVMKKLVIGKLDISVKYENEDEVQRKTCKLLFASYLRLYSR